MPDTAADTKEAIATGVIQDNANGPVAQSPLGLSELRSLASIWSDPALTDKKSWTVTVGDETKIVTKDMVVQAAKSLLKENLFNNPELAAKLSNFNTPQEWDLISKAAQNRLDELSKYQVAIETPAPPKADSNAPVLPPEAPSPGTKAGPSPVPSGPMPGVPTGGSGGTAQVPRHGAEPLLNLNRTKPKTPVENKTPGEKKPDLVPSKHRSLEYEPRMKLLQEWAAFSGPDIRHDLGGWLSHHFVSPFRDNWERAFGSPRQIPNPPEKPSYVLYYTETYKVVPLYMPENGDHWRPYYTGFFNRGGESNAPMAFSFHQGGTGLGEKISFAPGIISGEKGKASEAKKAKDTVANAKKLIDAGQNVARASAGDVTAMIALAKMALQSPTVRKIIGAIAGLWSMAMIMLAALIAKFGLMAGLALGGGVIGFIFGGPIGALLGAGIGMGIGWLINETGLGSFLGSAGSGAVSLASAAASFISSIIGAGGAALAALGGSFAALVVGAAIVIPAFFNNINQSLIAEAARDTTSGNLITIAKSVDKSQLPNNPNDQVVYTVTISSNQSQPVNILVDDSKIYDLDTAKNQSRCSLTMPAPTKAYPATISPGQPVTITYAPFKIVNSSGPAGCNFNDSVIVNTVAVTASLPGSPSENDSAQATVTVGNPPINSTSCPLAPDSSPCAVAKLLPYFDNDQVKAENASRICYKENPSQDPSSIFDACTLNPQGHREYSVGLFQINLFAHDNLCFPGTFPQPLSNGPYPASNACVRDNTLLQLCKSQWTSQNCVNYSGLPHPELPDCNIKETYVLSSGGTNWSAWSTAAPQYCNIH